MRNIYDEELNILWNNYNDIINKVGFYSMLEDSTKSLQEKFTLLYKQLYFQVKTENSWKPENEMKYNLLKLRRLLGLWQSNDIINIEGGVHYSDRDVYRQFPLYAMQNPRVVPTIKTINKLRVKALIGYVEEKNIKDLRSLRGHLVRVLKIDSDTATFLTKLYGKMQAKKEINDFSQKGDLI